MARGPSGEVEADETNLVPRSRPEARLGGVIVISYRPRRQPEHQPLIICRDRSGSTQSSGRSSRPGPRTRGIRLLEDGNGPLRAICEGAQGIPHCPATPTAPSGLGPNPVRAAVTRGDWSWLERFPKKWVPVFGRERPDIESRPFSPACKLASPKRLGERRDP